MKQSVRKAIITIGSDLNVRDKYLTFFKTVRIGKLLEDMDSLAGVVGYKYYKGPSENPTATFALVTASVEKFNLKESNIRSDKNITMTGFVSWAGKTSLEITINLGEFCVFMLKFRLESSKCVIYSSFNQKFDLLDQQNQQLHNCSVGSGVNGELFVLMCIKKMTER